MPPRITSVMMRGRAGAAKLRHLTGCETVMTGKPADQLEGSDDMDRYIGEAASQVLTDLANNGGGTYHAGTLLPFTPSDGYAVAEGGVAIPATQATIENLAFLCRSVAGEYITSYVGTWLKDGIVYIDAVDFWRDRDYAIAKGREFGQEAIYDFAAKEVITL